MEEKLLKKTQMLTAGQITSGPSAQLVMDGDPPETLALRSQRQGPPGQADQLVILVSSGLHEKPLSPQSPANVYTGKQKSPRLDGGTAQW